MKKDFVFLLRYTSQPPEKLLSRSHSSPEWQMYLIDDNKKLYHISELKKSSKDDYPQSKNPYKIFPNLPKITGQDYLNAEAYSTSKSAYDNYKRHHDIVINNYEEWVPKSRWFKFWNSRPDIELARQSLESHPVPVAHFKEIKYNVTIEESESSESNLLLKSSYLKAAGHPAFEYYSVFHKKKLFFSLWQPVLPSYDYEFYQLSLKDPHSIEKRKVWSIFPKLPNITNDLSGFKKYYHFTASPID